MSGFIAEFISRYEEENTSRSPPPVWSDSLPRAQGQIPGEIDSTGGIQHPAPYADNTIANHTATNEPNYNLTVPFGEGTSSWPFALPAGFLDPIASELRHPRPAQDEPPTQRRRLTGNWDALPETFENRGVTERFADSGQLGEYLNLSFLNQGGMNDIIPPLILRATHTEGLIEELKEENDRLKIVMGQQDSRITIQEAEMTEVQERVYMLEDKVRELQDKIARFENMFEAIARAATVAPSGPSR